MKKVLSISLVIICFGCQTPRIRTDFPVSFSELWKADTCGMKGYREFVVEYIDQNKYNILEGQPLEYLEYYFGQPDSKSFTEEWNIIHYSYNCSAAEIKDDGSCGEPTNTSYYININAKTKKVIDAVKRIHD